MSGQLKD